MICAVHVSAQTPLYKQSSAPVESRVKDLLGRMTVDEKICIKVLKVIKEQSNLQGRDLKEREILDIYNKIKI